MRPDEWSSYDQIADAYDRVWAGRFEPVALEMAARLVIGAGSRLLDVGTGTGIVLRTLAQLTPLRCF